MKNDGLLAAHYRDEDAAREHLEKTRWPEGPVCPHCGAVDEATKLEPRNGSKKAVRKGVWQCNGCRKQFTVTVGTIFEDSHIPLHKWLTAIHLMVSSKKGVSAHQLMRNLGLGSYRTAWFMAHRIRWALTQDPVKQVLSGIVEIDETYVGGKIRTGRQSTRPGERPKDMPVGTSNKAPVVAVLQRGGCVRSEYVERVNSKNMKAMVERLVSDKAHLMSDSSTVLRGVEKRYNRHQVNHSAGEYVRIEGDLMVSTNSIESYFAILKRGNYGVYHHWSKKYMPQYLREFDWRYNVRKVEDSERAALVVQKAAGKRLLLKPLKDGKH